MAVDPLAALTAFLQADAGVSALAADRVFAGELPRDENESMPRGAVVLSFAGGGLLGRANQAWGDRRVDVDCYGETPHDAERLHAAVRAALRDLTRAVYAQTLIHWARISTDGTTTRDPRTDWPVSISSWQVLVGDVPVA